MRDLPVSFGCGKLTISLSVHYNVEPALRVD